MEPWFDPQMAGKLGGIIGTSFGLIGALIGCTSNTLVQKGWRKPMYAIFTVAIISGLIMLITGAIAFFTQQPYHVWYAFLLPGILCTCLFLFLLITIRKRFTNQELHKLNIADFVNKSN